MTQGSYLLSITVTTAPTFTSTINDNRYILSSTVSPEADCLLVHLSLIADAATGRHTHIARLKVLYMHEVNTLHTCHAEKTQGLPCHCGVFVLAYAYALLVGKTHEDISRTEFEHEKMHQDLIKCFENNKFSRFPHHTRDPPKTTLSAKLPLTSGITARTPTPQRTP